MFMYTKFEYSLRVVTKQVPAARLSSAVLESGREPRGGKATKNFRQDSHRVKGE
jgi:hypothetical protein